MMMYYFPWFYEDTLQNLEKNPQCAFTFLRSIVLTPQGVVLGVFGLMWEKHGLLSPTEAALEMAKKSIAPQGVLFQRWVLEKGLIDFSNQTVWDWDFLLHLAMRYPIYVSKKPGAVFLNHPGSFTYSTKFAIWFQSIQKMISRVNACNDFISKTSCDAIILALNSSIRVTPRIIGAKLADRKIQDAAFCLEIYRKDSGHYFIAAIFLAFINLSKQFAPILYLFSIARMIFSTSRKFIQLFKTSNINSKKMQKTYGEYAKWLQNESP